MALLDVLGATLVGTLTTISRITTDFAVETWPGDEATILLHGKRASAIGAAFANGYAANGLDIDDCALYTKGHPGAQITPLTVWTLTTVPSTPRAIPARRSSPPRWPWPKS
jgi:2-methylcitrate dehydratase PrpD